MKKIPVQAIIQLVNAVEYIGNPLAVVTAPGRLDDLDALDDTTISWCKDAFLHRLVNVTGGVIICSSLIKQHPDIMQPNCNYLLVENPKHAFSKVLGHFFSAKESPFISDKAVIAASARIGQQVTIGHFVVIEDGVEIGDNSEIGHGTVIKKNCLIGKQVLIGCNNTIGHVGFGYEKDENGHYQVLPHLGNVVIEDQVEIGNNTCIDRAVMGSTRIEANAKIDNLVHIAHGAVIGRNSLVIANAVVAGSVKVGENVWIAPSANIRNGLTIGSNALIGMGSVVVKDVEPNTTVAGNPARPLEKK